MMCHLLLVSKSAYYKWLKNPNTHRVLRKNKLQKTVSETFIQCKCLYGSIRLTAEINSNPMNERVSRTTVAK